MTDTPVTKKRLKSRLSEGLNEETICARIIVPYVRHILGWNIDEIHAECIVHPSSNKKVDYAVPNKDQPRILIEAKSLGTDLESNRGQLSEYLDLSDVEYGILTDGLNFEIMERNKKSQNRIIDTFSLTEEHLGLIEKNPSSNKGQKASRQELSDHIKEIFPNGLSEEMIRSFVIQHYTGISDELDPIHTFISVDFTMAETMRKGLYNTCKKSVCVKSLKKTDVNIIENCVDPNILIYDNIESGSTLSQKTISKSFSSVEIEDSSGLPKNIPIIILDSPKNGYWSDAVSVSEQLNAESSMIQSFDLVFAPEDDRNEARDREIAESYLSTVIDDKELTINSKEVNIEGNTEISDDIMELIQEFFVFIRNDTQVGLPISFRAVDTIVKITRATAYMHSSSIVKEQHFNIAKEIVLASLGDLGYNEDSGQFDNKINDVDRDDKEQERRRKLIEVIEDNEDEGEKGAPHDLIVETMTEDHGFDENEVEYDLRKMGRKSEKLYEPKKREYAML